MKGSQENLHTFEYPSHSQNMKQEYWLLYCVMYTK